MGDWAELGLGLVLMLAAAVLFTNSMEWLGSRLGLGHAATGGILAAIGTALPESVVPVVALLHGGPTASSTAVGAILGAPFMLATLGFGVTSVFCLAARRRRLAVPAAEARAPLYAFLVSYTLLMAGAFVPRPLRVADAFLLVALYGLYVYRSVRRSSGAAQSAPALLVSRAWSGRTSVLGAGQAILGVAGLAVASELFVLGLGGIAPALHVSAMVLALLLVPIATELPELTAGGLWVSRGRDALALGNVTGAMVFQATVPAVVGLCFTPWNPQGVGFLAAAVTVTGALIALAATSRRGVSAVLLAPAGLGLYAVYVVAVILGRP
ncbi:MAG: hypothetical protein WBU92_00430 [Candidatus Dormiibacterota bacterium]